MQPAESGHARAATTIKIDGLELEALSSSVLILRPATADLTSAKLIQSIMAVSEFQGAAGIVFDLSNISRVPKDLRETILGLAAGKKAVGIIEPRMWEGHAKTALAPLLQFFQVPITRSVAEFKQLTNAEFEDRDGTKKLILGAIEFLKQRKAEQAKLEISRLADSLQRSFQSDIVNAYRNPSRSKGPALLQTDLGDGSICLTCNREFLEENSREMRQFCAILQDVAQAQTGDVIVDLTKSNHLGAEAIGAFIAAHKTLQASGYNLMIENASPRLLKKLADMGLDQTLSMAAA